MLAVAAILLVLIALLAIPIDVQFRVAWLERWHRDIRVEWGFGLVRLRFSVEPREERVACGTERSRDYKSPRDRRRTNPNVIAAIRDREFRRRMLRFAANLWQAIHKQGVRARLRIGLGDPADTGVLWGLLGPLASMALLAREPAVTIEPDFLDATLEFDSSGMIRLIPLEVACLIVALLLSPQFWRGMRALRRRQA